MDEQPPAIIPPVPLPVIRRTSEKKFVKAIIVRTPDGQRLAVPSSSDAARAKIQLITARATEFWVNQMDEYKKGKIIVPPRDMKEFLASAEILTKLHAAAHGTSLIPDGGNPLSGLGQMVAGAAMAGAAIEAGKNVDLIDDMRKLMELNRKATAERKGKEIIVEEAK